MIFSIWGVDWFLFFIFNCCFLLMINFIYERELSIKFIYDNKLAKQQSRNYFTLFNNINICWNIALNKLYVYNVLLAFFALTYWYSWGMFYTSLQFYILPIGWYYLLILHLLLLTLYISFNFAFKGVLNIFNLRAAFIIGVLLFILYIFFNNYFLILFLIEIQGVIVIYLLSTSNLISLKWNDKYQKVNSYNFFYKYQLWYLASLFLYFWAAFVSAILFILVGLRFVYTIGAINWVDITYLSYFWLIFNNLNHSFTAAIGIIIFLVAALKMGIFPFHFWKPELYKKINLWTMFWYMMFYTFVLVFFLIIFFNYFLVNYLISWKIILYLLQLSGFLLVSNILYTVVEFRPFLAYMSIFHVLFIFALFILTHYASVGYAFYYLLMYTFLTSHLFIFLIILNNKEFRFLTDFQFLEQNLLYSFIFIVIIISMSGLPPFIGFWVKLTVITSLVSGDEYFLAFIALATGLFLMYFYLQNYRFSGNLKFNLAQPTYVKSNKVLCLEIIILVLVVLNFMYLFFVNDFLNWSLFIAYLY